MFVFFIHTLFFKCLASFKKLQIWSVLFILMKFSSSLYHVDNCVLATELVLLNILTLFYSRDSRTTTCCKDKVMCFWRNSASCMYINPHPCEESRKHVIFHWLKRWLRLLISWPHTPWTPCFLTTMKSEMVMDSLDSLPPGDKFRSLWLPERRSFVSSWKLSRVGEGSWDTFLMLSNFYSST